MRQAKTFQAMLYAWFAGALAVAAYSCQTYDLNPSDTQQRAATVLYFLAYGVMTALVAAFYGLHQGHKSNPKVWWSRLLIAHLAVLIIWAPIHIKKITTQMERNLPEIGFKSKAAKVFRDHPLIGDFFLNRVAYDPYRTETEREDAASLMRSIEGHPDSPSYCGFDW